MTEIDEGVFQVKPNLDYGKIEKESFPRMSEFMLSENDKEDIIDFCKEHEDKRGFVELTCENADGGGGGGSERALHARVRGGHTGVRIAPQSGAAGGICAVRVAGGGRNGHVQIGLDGEEISTLYV